MALCSSMCLDYAGSAADVIDELAPQEGPPVPRLIQTPAACPASHSYLPSTRFLREDPPPSPVRGWSFPIRPPEDVPAPGEGPGVGLPTRAKPP
jgi:hypothetical protein